MLKEVLKKPGLWGKLAAVVTVMFIGLILTPAVFDNLKMRRIVAKLPDISSQLSGLEKQRDELQEENRFKAVNNHLLQQVILADACVQGDYGEVLHLVQLYDLTVKKMQTDGIWREPQEAAIAWQVLSVSFKLLGRWDMYARFKRALSAYPCLTQVFKERVVAAGDPNFIIADIALSIFKLPNGGTEIAAVE